jgi:hypothetical protein
LSVQLIELNKKYFPHHHPVRVFQWIHVNFSKYATTTTKHLIPNKLG